MRKFNLKTSYSKIPSGYRDTLPRFVVFIRYCNLNTDLVPHLLPYLFNVNLLMDRLHHSTYLLPTYYLSSWRDLHWFVSLYCHLTVELLMTDWYCLFRKIRDSRFKIQGSRWTIFVPNPPFLNSLAVVDRDRDRKNLRCYYRDIVECW